MKVVIAAIIAVFITTPMFSVSLTRTVARVIIREEEENLAKTIYVSWNSFTRIVYLDTADR